jgi:beta-glucosidase
MNSFDPLRLKAHDITAQMTLDEKLGFVTTRHKEVPRLGLKKFSIGTEAARGFVGREEKHFSTVTPQPVGMAGTFDTGLMRELGDIAGNEARAYYNCDGASVLCLWGPTVDMERDPRWGRTEEAYGEDVCLAGEMTAAYTRGLAGDHPVYMKTIPALKHFCANNNEHNRGSCDAYLPPRLKHEYYYAAFRNAVVNGGARSVMTAYNEINGLPGMLNTDVRDILMNDWGIWFAVTDGGDFSQTLTYHHFLDSHAETFAQALKAGVGTMTDLASLSENAAKNALDRGLITTADLDEAVENLIFARLKLGHLAEDCPYDSITTDCVDTDETRKVNLRAALEQMVLLKNDGTLPLKKSAGTIAVVGALADESLMDWYTGVYRDAVSAVEGIRRQFPESNVVTDSLWDRVAVKCANGKYLAVHEDGSASFEADCVSEYSTFELQDWGENWQNLYSPAFKKYLRVSEDGTLRLHNRTIYDWFTRETLNLFPTSEGVLIEEFLTHKRLTCGEDGKVSFTADRFVSPEKLFSIEVVSAGRERAAHIAEKADAVVYCVGNYPVQVAKECHDRKTLALNIQPGMALHLHSHNPNTVMAVISSYPYSICQENEVLPAILYSTHAGAHLGTALAMVLSGDHNPAGRLAMTWYRSELDLPDIMNYDIESGGTTYMYFRGKPLYSFGYGLSYSQFEYTGISAEPGKVSVSVKNLSGIGGDEVVQVYFSVENSALSRPIKKLCAFSRVHLAPYEEKTVTLDVPEHILQVYDTHTCRMITEKAEYTFLAGGSSDKLPVSCTITLGNDAPGVRPESFPAELFDSASGVRIKWSKQLRKYLLTAEGWGGSAVYKAVPTGGKSKLAVRASSVSADAVMYVSIGSQKYEVSLAPSLGYGDVKEYTLEIPGNVPEISEVTVSLSEGVSVLDISVR